MAFDKFVDMELDDEDKVDMAICCGPAPESGKLVPQYPYGLRISLTGHEIERLDLDPEDVDVGDYIHMKVFARVTSKSIDNDTDSRTGERRERVRIELQIEKIAAEDEDDE
jgi:ATP-dependent helicase/DNAse subunit B